MGKLVQFDKYIAEDAIGAPCVGEGCACKKHKKDADEYHDEMNDYNEDHK